MPGTKEIWGNVYGDSIVGGDATLEATASNIGAMAEAIQNGTLFHSKRLACVAVLDRVYWWSPKGSTMPGVSSLTAAVSLARRIQEDEDAWRVGGEV
jgi:hypothetical protein